MALNDEAYFIGVDVGTSSARAALVSANGQIICVSSSTLKIWTPQPDHYQQSSDDIWRACVETVKNVTEGIDSRRIKGIGFDATCSLVVLDADGQPLSISCKGESEQNVMMWMDHRAKLQAATINQTKHGVLNYVGGAVSIEMQMPKLLWIKENLPDVWRSAAHFFDLPDYLTWRATGCLTRSLCSLVCKWNYQCHDDRKYWPDDFLSLVGLDDLIKDNHTRIGCTVRAPGTSCGSGLTEGAASELALCSGTAVATSMIDAHAGALGCLSSVVPGAEIGDVTSRIAMICGTSTCHMLSSDAPIFVPGVWGPYNSAIIPSMWTNEAGQSAAGKLIDHVIERHPAYGALVARAHTNNRQMHDELSAILTGLVTEGAPAGRVDALTERLHMWPDYHGNRSPLADPTLRGMISGLTLSCEVEDLAVLYLATIQSLAYGTRHILEALTSQGHVIKTITACGGLAKNWLYIKMHANITGLSVVLPKESESVLLGASILGACASGHYVDVHEAVRAMSGTADVIIPDPEVREFHDRKYRVFLAMVTHQREYQQIMQQ